MPRSRACACRSYITRADIAARRPARATDLLRRISSIKVIDSAGVLIPVSRRSDKPIIAGQNFDLAPCPLRVAVDGHLRESGFAVNSIAPEEIHGIEVYPGPGTIPAEYGLDVAGLELRADRYLDSTRQVTS